MPADISRSEAPRRVGAVVPIGQAPSHRAKTHTADELRHDNPRWPVRSPVDAADALLLHSDCPWHCSTRVAAIIVSRDDYRFFRVRDRRGGGAWTLPWEW